MDNTKETAKIIEDFGINAMGGFNIYYNDGSFITVDKKTLIKMLNNTIK